MSEDKLRLLREKEREARKKNRWLRTKMWFSTFISMFQNDRGSIPRNIGDNVMITNNTYITKYSINAVILVKEMSQDTPLAWMSDIQKAVKKSNAGVQVGITVKARKYFINPTDTSLKSRIRTWELTLDNPFATEFQKQRAARCIYTADIANSGAKFFKGVTFITIRAQNGRLLKSALQRAEEYLNSVGAAYRHITSNLQSYMGFMLTMSDRRDRKVRDIPAMVYSRQTISESLPITQGMNDNKGTFMGIDTLSNTPYLIDFRSSAGAKNIYVAASSGSGKTVLVQNWFMDMSTDGYNMCIMDIKGTEFTAFTEARGGVVISLSPSSTYYVNTFRLDKTEAQGNTQVYFAARFNLSKKKMLCLANLGDLESRGDELLEEFLKAYYREIGVSAQNPNSWDKSHSVTPYEIYAALQRYVSYEIVQKYSDVAVRLLSKLEMYMSTDGSASHIFQTPLEYKSILDTPVLTFSFGIIDGAVNYDDAMFKARVLDMSVINEEYIAGKARKGEWTGKVLEESQIAPDYLISLYQKDFTIRRSQNQVTILLGNSVSALANNPFAKGILENINILVLGDLPYDSREYLTRQYGLEDYADMLDSIRERCLENEHAFILINHFSAKATMAKLKAFIPKNVIEGSLYKQVNTDAQ